MRLFYSVIVLLYMLLLAAGIGGLWWHAPGTAGTSARIIMASAIYLPLVVTGLGVLLRDARLLTWLCFVLLFYFCGYVTQVLEPDMRLLALTRITLVVLLFTLTLVYIRALKRHAASSHKNRNPS